ncbi:MAG TPA: hypothetical protein VFO18_08545 [Methylomirabilota bacterium]|nr:hypothetical protein [Methylomirabilota bacterium]
MIPVLAGLDELARLPMLDEPLGGLGPKLVSEIVDVLARGPETRGQRHTSRRDG